MPATGRVDLAVAGARGRRVARLLALPSAPGRLFAAALVFSASLAPSLYPRPWLAQGLLSGAALALGYGTAAAVGAGWRLVVRRDLPTAFRGAGRRAAAVLTVGTPVASLAVHHRWQTDVRRLMDMPPAPAYTVLAVTAVALGTAYLLVVAGRSLRAAHAGYGRLVARLVPRGWRLAVRVAVAVALVVLVTDVVAGGWVGPAFNDALLKADAHVDPAVRRPASASVAGGAGSLIAWETLGSRGRAFVSDAPTTDELAVFNGRPATEPIRVYAGLASAGSHRERAALAVAELDRAGAFEREALLVITPTGTGSVNPDAVGPLEYLYNGDTASVAVQYSYLPSWLVMAGNQEHAKRGARALFDAVTRRLDEEPAASRPQLFLYGESLGSFGSEAVFDGLDDLRARVDGVLWVGPPRANPLWRELTEARDPGSPVWQPVYEGGAHVRFGWDGPSLSRPDRPWVAPRVAYLQHPTDPVVWWSPSILFEQPAWLREPRGPDVSPQLRYLPVVTFVQVTVDTVLGASAPVGHGHIYGPAQAEAWALVAAPHGWTAEDTARLRAAVSASAR